MGLLDGLIGAAQGVGQAGKQYTDASIEEDRRAREALAAHAKQQEITRLQHMLRLEGDAVNNDRADTRQGAGFTHAENMQKSTQAFELPFKQGALDNQGKGLLLESLRNDEAVRSNKAREGLQGKEVDLRVQEVRDRNEMIAASARVATATENNVKASAADEALAARWRTMHPAPQDAYKIGKNDMGNTTYLNSRTGAVSVLENGELRLVGLAGAPTSQVETDTQQTPSSKAKKLGGYGRSPR